MASAEIRFSVIICAYTEARWDELQAAVASVQRQTLPAHEIILVIDHNPALLERASLQISGARVIANHQARGLSGARNSGIAAAQGDILAFMDEDALANEDWLAQLSQGFANPQVQGVGGAILPLWPDGRPGWFPPEFDWVVGCTYRGMPETVQPVRNLIGCNMAFRRTAFALAGGFRDGIGRIGTLPVGCEETELCIRLRQQDPHSVLLYQPAARVQHHVTPNRATWKYFFSRCYAEGLSKALVSRLVGAGDGLSSERSYTLRTLPLGVLNGLVGAFNRRSLANLTSAVAIISGLLVTTYGYLKGTFLSRTTSLQPDLEPVNP